MTQYFLRFLLLFLAVLIPAGCSPGGNSASAGSSEPAASATAENVSEAGMELTAVKVTTKSGASHDFTVEVARTDKEQARGMMFRTELADDAGMLFPYAEPQILGFWMKNTVIPLDIIYIRSDGTIESIAAMAEPYSKKTIRSGEPVVAVLELAGGRAAELGIKPGDKVSWPGQVIVDSSAG